jgi:purine-binding chemotaxis protein CheW
MGRTADDRRRTAQKKVGPRARPQRPRPAAAAPALPVAAEPLPHWEFPADESSPPVASEARIHLPASGLAADILSRPEAARVGDAARTELAERDPDPAPEGAVTATHSLSFFAAPAREEKKAVEATEHLATFMLAGEEYGVDVRLVQEIIRVSEITQVPRAPEFIKGVINLRGRIIPVIDLKRKLSLGSVELARETRIVVVKLKERLIGLLVDGASQVLKVPVSVIEAAPEEVVEIDASAVRGVAKLEQRLIILIDLFRILAPELRDGPTPP